MLWRGSGGLSRTLFLLHPLVVVDFLEARVCDYSSIEAINSLAERYSAAGKQLKLRHLSPECRKLLKNAKHLVEVDIIEDPHYQVAKL